MRSQVTHSTTQISQQPAASSQQQPAARPTTPIPTRPHLARHLRRAPPPPPPPNGTQYTNQKPAPQTSDLAEARAAAAITTTNRALKQTTNHVQDRLLCAVRCSMDLGSGGHDRGSRNQKPETKRPLSAFLPLHSSAPKPKPNKHRALKFCTRPVQGCGSAVLKFQIPVPLFVINS
jgi:hypothetical protein